MPSSIAGNMDKLIHLLVYSLLGLLFTRALVRGMRIEKRGTTIALALAASFLFGALTEVTQHFVPYRDASLLDMAANGAGAFIGVFIYIFITKTSKGQGHASS